ncbi:MAG TPA: hypothetical protein VLL54_00220 [Pyrinomonadaceae bacterium]|nr:hypothetical protein [Pyrinomonadaceae bacterium]
MKTLKLSIALVGFLFLTCAAGIGQENQTTNSDELRKQLQQIEALAVESKPAVIQDLHKRTLLSIRKQLAEALDDDLKTLKVLQAASNGDSETRKEIDVQIQALRQERDDLVARINQTEANPVVSATESEGTRSSGISSEGNRRAVGTSPVAESTAAPVPRRLTSSGPAVSSRLHRETAAMVPLPAPQDIDVKSCKLINTYKDAPEVLLQKAEQAAASIRQATDDDPADRVAGITAVYKSLMFFTVADAVLPDGVQNDQGTSIRDVDRLQYLGETARTDKQIGSSTRSAGSTSAIEKPGFARLLGFAIENGGILQDINNSTVTLSTSPYVLYTMNGGGDSVENYNKAGYLNRIGLSASFAMTDSANPLASVRRGNLTEWGVKTRLFGDRSTRSKQFQKFWDTEVRPFVEEKGRALGDAKEFIDGNDTLRTLSDQTESKLTDALVQVLADPDYKSATDAQKETMLENVMLCFMKASVYDPIRSNTIDVGLDARTKINNEFVPRIAQAFANMSEAKKRLSIGLDQLAKSPLATFAYTNHRVATGSDYSEFKFVYEQDKTIASMFKLVGNAGFTVYNKPNALLRQTRIRDFAMALSLEGSVDSPFLKNQPDMSKITYAFTGNYQRMKENVGVANRKPDLAAFQFKLDVPIYGGLTLPLAVTYASGTEHTNQEHTRFNFGFKFDMDKLFALTKLIGQP